MYANVASVRIDVKALFFVRFFLFLSFVCVGDCAGGIRRVYYGWYYRYVSNTWGWVETVERELQFKKKTYVGRHLQ